MEEAPVAEGSAWSFTIRRALFMCSRTCLPVMRCIHVRERGGGGVRQGGHTRARFSVSVFAIHKTTRGKMRSGRHKLTTPNTIPLSRRHETPGHTPQTHTHDPSHTQTQAQNTYTTHLLGHGDTCELLQGLNGAQLLELFAIRVVAVGHVCYRLSRVCVCVCARARACVRACVRAFVRAFVHACMVWVSGCEEDKYMLIRNS